MFVCVSVGTKACIYAWSLSISFFPIFDKHIPWMKLFASHFGLFTLAKVGRVFANGPGDRVQSQVELYQRFKK